MALDDITFTPQCAKFNGTRPTSPPTVTTTPYTGPSTTTTPIPAGKMFFLIEKNNNFRCFFLL
jgi:hypothetical protein